MIMKLVFTLMLLGMSVYVLPAFAIPNSASLDAAGFKNLSTALTAPGTVGKTVVISMPMVINNKVLPSDRHIAFVRGGRIDVAAGKVFDFAGQIPEAGDYQISGGIGTIAGIGESRPEWWGAKKDGSDDSVAVTSAITALGKNGTLQLGKGTYAFNIETGNNGINIRGSGIGGTIITSYSAASAAIILRGYPSWNFMEISDLSIEGDSGTRSKSGVQFGHTVYQTGDELAGRVVFRNVGFKWLDKCITRLYGNIGVYIYNCNFSAANYHIWTAGLKTPIMHGGCLIVRDSHFEAAQLAVVYMDSPHSGTGQVTFDSCIMELNPGFVFFIKSFFDVSLGEGFIVENCWNEQNFTATNVTIDGKPYKPRHLYAKNTAHVRFEDTTMGSVELIDSNLTTNHCQLDVMTLTKDASSSVFHDNAIYESGKNDVGLVNSLQNMTRSYGGYASIAYLPHRTTSSKRYAESILHQDIFSVPVTYVGTSTRTTTSATDGVLYGQTTVQDLVIQKADILFPNTGQFNISPNKYFAWYFTYKLISGVGPRFQITKAVSLVGSIILDNKSWTTIGGITNTFNSKGLPNSVTQYLTGLGTCTLRMAGFAVVSFDTKQEALEFINSKVHPLP